MISTRHRSIFAAPATERKRWDAVTKLNTHLPPIVSFARDDACAIRGGQLANLFVNWYRTPRITLLELGVRRPCNYH